MKRLLHARAEADQLDARIAGLSGTDVREDLWHIALATREWAPAPSTAAKQTQ